jgi:hypothetical protein
MERSTRPVLVVNPADDEFFGALADLLVDHGASSVRDLERGLRPIYSRAVVHARELSSEPFVIWYVYREGHWVGSDGGTHERPVAQPTGPAQRARRHP